MWSNIVRRTGSSAVRADSETIRKPAQTTTEIASLAVAETKSEVLQQPSQSLEVKSVEVGADEGYRHLPDSTDGEGEETDEELKLFESFAFAISEVELQFWLI